MPKGSVPRNIHMNTFVKRRRMDELYASKTSTAKEKKESFDKWYDATEYGSMWRGPDKSKEWTTRSKRTPAAKTSRLERLGLSGTARLARKSLAKKTKASRVGLKPIKRTPVVKSKSRGK